jgi:hypothetical protein
MRRTKAEIERIENAIFRALLADRPMTVRQLFYRLVSSGVIEKTEAEYKTTVVRLTGRMRRSGDIPFAWIADETRWMRKPNTHSSLADMLRDSAQLYRRSVWEEQGVYVEVWLEKDALAGVLYEVTSEWDVPLMVTRGYPSLSYLYSAAEAIEECGKPAHLYYFGDYDPSGVDIPRKVEADLRQFAPTAEIHFTRVAVNHRQIRQWNLPTRPTKKTDSRSKGFGSESVEVDAIPPEQLRELVRSKITRHIDAEAYHRMQNVEAAEREALANLAAGYSRDSEELL